MKLRDYAAIMTGALTFVAAAMAQWVWTQRPIEDVIFIALMVAFVGAGIFVGATEPKHPQRRRHRARPINCREQDEPVFITLDRRIWNDGKRY